MRKEKKQLELYYSARGKELTKNYNYIQQYGWISQTKPIRENQTQKIYTMLYSVYNI